MRSREYAYFFAGLFIYLAAVIYLHFSYYQPFGDFLTVFLTMGAGFSIIAWLLLKDEGVASNRAAIKKEVVVLILLLAWIVAYITWGAVFINQFIPHSWIANKKLSSFINVVRKLLMFVAVPWLVYRSFGFTGEDFGFKSGIVIPILFKQWR
jgi:hypothetical protein